MFFDRRTVLAGLLPPGFRADGALPFSSRRLLAALLLVCVFWLGVFLPLATLGAVEPDLPSVSRAQLFLLHAVFLLTLVLWYLLGFVGVREEAPVAASDPAPAPRFLRQFGLNTPEFLKEIGLGLAAGFAAWVAVLAILIMLGFLIWTLGGEEAMPQQPPAMVPWIAALPVGLRIAISLSAGFAEELFFRGFLQPRSGIAFSTILFVLAHAGYGQPLMLVGVTLLSLVFAGLVRWRQNIWAAIVAHAVFDALQLLLVIPKALELLEGTGGLV